MNSFREYFIGGPLDGKEKLASFPNIPEWGIVAAMEVTGDAIVTHEGNGIRSLDIEWHYKREGFQFGGLYIPFWTDHRFMSRELITFRLAELLMAPHRVKVNLRKAASA